MTVQEILEMFIDPESQRFELFDLNTTETIFEGYLSDIYEDYDEEEAEELLEQTVYSIDNIGGKYGDSLVLNIETDEID